MRLPRPRRCGLLRAPEGSPSRERADDPSPGRRRSAARDRGLGGGRRAALEIAGNGTKRILGRPVEAEHLVSVAEPRRHHALRAGRAGDVRRRRHTSGHDRGRARRARPGADVRARRLWRAARGRPRQPDDRRRVRRQCRRAAPAEVGGGARPPARAALRHRPRPGDQDRRPGGQERHRLRPVQAAHRLLGHAGAS